MFDKKAVFLKDDLGNVTEVLEVHSFHDPSEYASFSNNAKAQKEANAKKDKEEKEKEAEQKEKEQKEALQTAYYSKWRFILVCDELVNDWQIGNGNVSDELKDKALELRNSALASASSLCEEWLNTDTAIKKRYEEIFGRLE